MGNTNIKTETEEIVSNGSGTTHSAPIELKINLRNDKESEIQKLLLQEKMKIQQHANGYEKKAGKDIPQRKDMGQSLMAVFGFRDDQAGEECSQDEG